MRKIIALSFALIPALSVAHALDGVCSLNSDCQYGIQGRFNKIIHTSGIQPGTIITCRVNPGIDGHLFTIQNIQGTPGLTFSVGQYFNQPFVINASQVKQSAEVIYTIHNRDDIWSHDVVAYRCTTEKLK